MQRMKKRFLFRFLIIPKSLHWPGARASKVRFIECSSFIHHEFATGHEKETRGCKKKQSLTTDQIASGASPSTTNPGCDRNKAKSWLQKGGRGLPGTGTGKCPGSTEDPSRCASQPQALPCRRRSTVSACRCGGFRHIQVQQSDVVLATFSCTVHIAFIHESAIMIRPGL